MVRYLFLLGLALAHSPTAVFSQATNATPAAGVETVPKAEPAAAAAATGGVVLDGVTLSADCASGGQAGCITREAIEALSLTLGVDIAANKTNSTSFDVDRIMTCMAEMSTTDVDLISLSDIAWTKLVDYHNQNAVLNTNKTNATSQSGDFDIKPAPMQLHDGSVYLMVSEPCNAVSNLAFYRSILAFCEMEADVWTFDEETKKTMAQLQVLHGWSGTLSHISGIGSEVGQLLGDVTMQLMILLSYQGAVQNFKNEPIIYSFERNPTYASAVAATQKLAAIIMEEDVQNWTTELEALKDALPIYYSGVVGSLAVISNLMFPQEISVLINTVVGTILDVSTFPVQLGPALRDVAIDFSTSTALFQMAAGTMLKGMYSLLWMYIETDDPDENASGASAMPLINALGNLLTGFDHSHDPAVQEATDVYPGDQECRTSVGHAKFHEQLANTVIDIGLLNSAINGAINGKTLSPDMDGLELLICYEENQCTAGFNADAMTSVLGINANDCMPHLTFDPEAFPMVDIASFASCMFSSLIRAEGVQTLDSCLAENDCIQFTTQLMVQDEPLLNCILADGYTAPAPATPVETTPEVKANSTAPKEQEPIEKEPVEPEPTVRSLQEETAPVETAPVQTTNATDPSGSCASYVNQEDFSVCQSACEGSLCTLNCLMEHGDAGALYSTAFACMSALGSKDRDEAEEYKTLCMEQEVVLSATPSFMQLFIQGTRELVVCSATNCDASHSNFLSVIYGIPSCTSRCLEMAPEERMFPEMPYLGASLSCTLECYLQQQTTVDEEQNQQA